MDISLSESIPKATSRRAILAEVKYVSRRNRIAFQQLR